MTSLRLRSVLSPPLLLLPCIVVLYLCITIMLTMYPFYIVTFVPLQAFIFVRTLLSLLTINLLTFILILLLSDLLRSVLKEQMEIEGTILLFLSPHKKIPPFGRTPYSHCLSGLRVLLASTLVYIVRGYCTLLYILDYICVTDTTFVTLQFALSFGLLETIYTLLLLSQYGS